MKFSALTLLLAGAGVAMQVGAIPLRVVVLSPAQPTSLRIDSHVTDANNDVAKINMAPKKHCGFADKSLSFSNTLRAAFGLPVIEAHPGHRSEVHGGMIRIMPIMGTPGGPTFVEVKNGSAVTKGGDKVQIMTTPHRVHHHHHHHQGAMMHRGKTFLDRVHRSLMALGPWEGRAIAFVLGCGLGVLIRMIWVLCLVVVRSFKNRGTAQPALQCDHVVFGHYGDAEEILVPPPNYSFPNEKAAVEDVKQ